MKSARFFQPSPPSKTFVANAVQGACDGNSLMAGAHATSGFWTPPTVAKRLPPMSNAQNWVGVAIGGQTTRQMNGLDGGSTADIDAAYDGSKYCILSIWEGTNSISVNRSAQQAVDDLRDYIAARKAAHPWDAIIVTDTIPRYEPAVSTRFGAGQAGVDGYNLELLEYNRILANNYKDIGITRLVKMRDGDSPFGNFPDWTLATFEREKTFAYWSTAEPAGAGNHTHLSDLGFQLWGFRHNAQLARLPV